MRVESIRFRINREGNTMERRSSVSWTTGISMSISMRMTALPVMTASMRLLRVYKSWCKMDCFIGFIGKYGKLAEVTEVTLHNSSVENCSIDIG